MREGWKVDKIGNYVDLQQGFALNKKSDYHISDVPTQYPLLKISDLINNTETLFVKESIPKQFLIHEHELIFSRTGQVGLIFKGKKGVIYNNCFKIIPNELIDSDYIYYYFKQDYVIENVRNLATGAAQPDLNHSAFKSIDISFPESKETQRKIAKILSNYDDLIENNLKRIKILEEMAQQTFRNFVKNGSAKNWESKSLETLIDFHIGGGWGEEEFSNEFSETGYVIRGTDIDSLKKGENSKVPYRFHKISNIKSRQLEDGDIVFEVSGGSSNEGVAKSFLITSEVLQFFNDKVICASFCKLIRLKDRSLSHFFYYFLQYLRESKTTEIYEKRSASNIVNYNWEAFLKYQKILLPNPNEIKEFNDKVVKILKLTNLLGAKNQRLREARDILLPRLMMGLVDVEDIDL